MMNERKEMVLSLVLFLALILAGILTACKLGVTIEEAPTKTPTVTETIECGSIIPIEESPAAAERALFEQTCTNTPTVTPEPTPTATVTPVPTATPTEVPATATPKPTKRVATPTPTTAKVVPYPTGYPHTRKVDDPDAHAWKPYARYWKITKKNSAEYRLQQIAHAASNGLRVVTDPNGVERYCIALEPMWAGGQSVDIGRCIDIKMANGAVLHCVLADCKRTENSYNQEGWYGSRGELIEFIVDETKLPEGVHGDISNVSKEFAGGITSVTVLDLYIDGFGG